MPQGARVELTTTSTKENAYQLAKRNKAHEAVATIEQYMDKRRRNAFMNNAQVLRCLLGALCGYEPTYCSKM